MARMEASYWNCIRKSRGRNRHMSLTPTTASALSSSVWRKRSIPTHSGWLYPLTFDAGKGLKEA